MKQPEKCTIHDVFDGSVRYAAPVFQRYYVWGDEELQALLEDINTASEDGIQFIGASVVQDFGKKGGNQSPNEYLLIDGQQRLTTIYLILCGIVWCYMSKNKTDEAKTIAQTYLAYSAGKYAGMPKLLPTSQDRHQLFTLLTTDVDCIGWNFSETPADTSSKRTGISDQWARIKSFCEESFYGGNNRLLLGRLEAFQFQLLNYVEIVQITLDTKDDANTVFSKLNFMGIPLSIADLVRNDVFSRFPPTDQQKARKFYDDKWSKFEKSFAKGTFDQYVSIYAQIKFKGNCPKAKAFPKLQDSWKGKGAQAILNELSTFSDIYIALVKYAPLKGIHKDVNEQIRRLSYMPKTTVTWPYLMQVISAFRDKKLSRKQTIDCLRIVESFLVRRAIAGLEPTGLHAVFKSLWNKAGGDKKLLKDKIVTTTIRCPGDDEIKNMLLHENMYTRQITKYLLIQQEVSYNKAHGYDNATSNFSAEHVMPKNYVGAWKTIFTKEEHTALLNVIGNLVPLTKEQNSKIKDADWSKKKQVFKGSNWKITQKASALQKWDQKQIKKRCKDFATWALSEWPEIDTI